MALTQFIKDLLYLNDKLIIPGFGGFVAQYVPAQFNSEKQTLTPPVKYFIFDSALKEDDGVFAAYISRKKSISIDQAASEIGELVAEFNNKLQEGNTLLIDEVGYLVLDDNKSIRFKRNEEVNYHPDSFGLSAVSIKPPARNAEAEDVFVAPVKKKSIAVKILIIFLLINFLGALSAFIYWKSDDIKAYFNKLTAKKTETPVQEPEKHEYSINPDSSQIGQYIDTSTNIKNALRYEEPKKDTLNVVSEPQKIYYIIAGSFQSFDKAEVHAKLLTKQGLKPEIIEFKQELFRISVGEFKTKEEALQQLEFIKSKKGAEKAWLLAK